MPSILLCEPRYYGIYYEINPWMQIKNPASFPKAQKQWLALVNTLKAIGIRIVFITPQENLPDMTFTANAGLVYQRQVWISSFANKERQAESNYCHDWFLQQGMEIINPNYRENNHFEGEGDALFLGNTLIAAYGFRSDKKIYQHPFFTQHPLLLLELVHPYFYHLDTCFCPLNADFALWYPQAFSPASQQKLHRLATLFPVPDIEAKRFACNSIVIGKHVLIPENCPITASALQEHGFSVYPCEMSEFIKAGGACKCLGLTLETA